MQNNHQSHEEEEEKELTFKGEESESEMLEQLILED